MPGGRVGRSSVCDIPVNPTGLHMGHKTEKSQPGYRYIGTGVIVGCAWLWSDHGTAAVPCVKPFVKVLICWAIGKRITDRLPKPSVITPPPGRRRK